MITGFVRGHGSQLIQKPPKYQKYIWLQPAMWAHNNKGKFCREGGRLQASNSVPGQDREVETEKK